MNHFKTHLTFNAFALMSLGVAALSILSMEPVHAERLYVDRAATSNGIGTFSYNQFVGNTHNGVYFTFTSNHMLLAGGTGYDYLRQAVFDVKTWTASWRTSTMIIL